MEKLTQIGHKASFASTSTDSSFSDAYTVHIMFIGALFLSPLSSQKPMELVFFLLHRLYRRKGEQREKEVICTVHEQCMRSKKLESVGATKWSLNLFTT